MHCLSFGVKSGTLQSTIYINERVKKKNSKKVVCFVLTSGLTLLIWLCSRKISWKCVKSGQRERKKFIKPIIKSIQMCKVWVKVVKGVQRFMNLLSNKFDVS